MIVMLATENLTEIQPPFGDPKAYDPPDSATLHLHGGVRDLLLDAPGTRDYKLDDIF
jgi:hypothetical protein